MCIIITFHFIKCNTETNSCTSWYTLIRVISWNNVTILISANIIKVHWNLITPNTIIINKHITLNTMLFNLVINSFTYHFNTSRACYHITHLSQAISWCTILSNGIRLFISNYTTNKNRTHIKFIIKGKVCTCNFHLSTILCCITPIWIYIY